MMVMEKCSLQCLQKVNLLPFRLLIFKTEFILFTQKQLVVLQKKEGLLFLLKVIDFKIQEAYTDPIAIENYLWFLMLSAWKPQKNGYVRESQTASSEALEEQMYLRRPNTEQEVRKRQGQVWKTLFPITIGRGFGKKARSNAQKHLYFSLFPTPLIITRKDRLYVK